MIFLPFFPLNLVVYPHEDLNLHIFEPRYKQLINECFDEGKTFGIPAFISNKLQSHGTEMRVLSISKKYEDGRMDISCKGLRIFKVLTFENPVPHKLYAGGSVTFVENENSSEVINPFLMTLVERLSKILEVKIILPTPHPQPFSYRVAHKIGLSITEEYELLTIPTEARRQLRLIEHLERILPIVSEVERAKERISMNGHFKNLDPINF